MASAQPTLMLHWTGDCSVGIERFDLQHQKFFILVERLYNALRFRGQRAAIGELLGEFYAYSVSHMTDEEDLMQEHGYPQLDQHRTSHLEFRRRVREYMHDFDSGNTAIAVSVLQFTQEWLQKHLLEEDRLYIEFFRSKAIR